MAQILYDNIDEDHLMTIAEILQILQDKYGIDSYCATIKSDIEMLMEAGFDIEFVKPSQNQYHIVSYEFDIAELKIMIDDVESAKFISKDKSQKLVEKISKLAGFFAVEECKLRYDGYWYQLSPYRLVWNGEYYYVVGYYEKYHEVVSYRVDRMVGRPEILEDDAIPPSKSFDLDKHLNSMFHMYSTERKCVKLIVANDCMDALIDKFGEDVETYTYDPDSFF